MTTARTTGRRASAVAVLAAASALWFAACGDDGSGAGTEAGTDAGEASADADGAALYQQACASCHGADLRGTDRGPSHLSEVYEPGHHSDASFRAAVTQGSPAHHWQFGDMPALPGLDDDEIDAIIAYIREQQQAEGFELYPPR